MLSSLRLSSLRGRRFDLGSEDTSNRGQTIWAVASIVVLTVVLVAMGLIYLKPPGYSTYHVALVETGGLKAGDGVRMSGVTVGKVLGLELKADHVDVEFSVKEKYRLGDKTSVDVRMLTPVGGLYMAVASDGTKPLKGPIPAERATLPFLVNDLVPEAKEIADEIDVTTLRESLVGAGTALEGAPDSVRNSVGDLESVVGVIAEQKKQIEELLTLSNEFIAAANDNKELATEVIRAYALLGPQIVAARSKVETFANKTTIVVGLLFDFLSGPYASKVEPLLYPIEDASDLSKQLLASTDEMITSMRTSVSALADLSGPEGQALIDQSQLTQEAPNVCIPTPGMVC